MRSWSPACDGRSQGHSGTSAVIDLATSDLSDLPAEPLVTTITLAELSVGPHLAADSISRGSWT